MINLPVAKCPKCEKDMVPLFKWAALADLYYKCTSCGYKVDNSSFETGDAYYNTNNPEDGNI